MDVLAGIGQTMDVPLGLLRELVAAPYLTRNDKPLEDKEEVEAQEEPQVVEEEPAPPTHRRAVRTADIYSGLFSTQRTLQSSFSS